MMRLDRFLAINKYGTRQEVKKMIRAGRTTVDGQVIKSPEYKLEEETAKVAVDGSIVSYEKYHYIMLYKPAGCVSTTYEKGERSVLSYIDEIYASDLFPVGRLDKDTQGLLLLTNDGGLSHQLLSPSKHVDKRYYVELEKEVSEDAVWKFQEGIDIGDEDRTLPAVLELTSHPHHVYVTLHEGRYHQIKRMFEALDNRVVYLKRISMKELVLDETLKPGEYRKLTEEEIKKLKGC
ncbi:MAG: rRNA pseudouridine synthase [Lachnospiraceae bacterium]|nr:rRNA pseudouridine synthase [Lachnospiraceae bacterium]